MVEPRIFGAMVNYISEHLNSINLKHYSQTCSSDHLCKTTKAESAQANSLPIVTVQDDHLSNTTSNHFFLTPKWKKTVQNNNYKTLSSEGMPKEHKEQCIKNKHLSDYIYSIANL